MHPGGHGQARRHRRRHGGGGGAADADFGGVGFALVLGAVSCLLLLLCGGDGGGGQPAPTPGMQMQWQVILAFGTMAAGLLLVMHGIRARGARPPPVLVRRVAGAAGVMWHAGGPERLLAALLLLPLLEAWFDFF